MGAAWSSFIDFLSKIIVPDWGSVVALIPLLLIPLVLLFLAGATGMWAIHAVRQPHARTHVVEGPTYPERDADGRAVYPRGLPHCRRDELVFQPGTTRCDRCGNDLTVICPMCGVARDAAIDTCGNCGLVLQIKTPARFARPAGPPPGGAAIA